MLVRALVVQLISSAFGALPFVALVFFFYKLTMLSLWLRRAIFWAFLFCYILLCLMVISIFIASVSHADANKWLYTSTIDLGLTLNLGRSRGGQWNKLCSPSNFSCLLGPGSCQSSSLLLSLRWLLCFSGAERRRNIKWAMNTHDIQCCHGQPSSPCRLTSCECSPWTSWSTK